MAKKFEWDEKYSVRVDSLDEQHKHFFDITNELIDILEQPDSPYLRERLILTTVKLGRYALHHLDFEEKCIKRYKCKGCDGHENLHNIYRDKVSKYLKDVRKESTDIRQLAEEVAVFSQKWLSNHILRKDKDYVDCLKDEDIK